MHVTQEAVPSRPDPVRSIVAAALPFLPPDRIEVVSSQVGAVKRATLVRSVLLLTKKLGAAMVCPCVCVCMHVCMCVCMHVCVCACVCVCMCVCV